MTLDDKSKQVKEVAKKQSSDSDSEEYIGRRKKRILKSEISEEDAEMAGELDVVNLKVDSPVNQKLADQHDVEMIQTEDTRVETERKAPAPGKKLVKV